MNGHLLFFGCFLGGVFCDEPNPRFLWNGHVTLEGGLSQGHNETVGGDDITGEAKVNVGVHYDGDGDKGIFSDFINKFVGDNTTTTEQVTHGDDPTPSRVGNTGVALKRSCADVQLITTLVSALLKKRGIIKEDLTIVGNTGSSGCTLNFISVANALILKSLKMLVGSSNTQKSTTLWGNTSAIMTEAEKTYNTIKMLLGKPTCQNNVGNTCPQKNPLVVISGLLEYFNVKCGGCFTRTQIAFDRYTKSFGVLAMMMRLIRGDQIAWTQTATLDALKSLVGLQSVRSTKTSANTQKVAITGTINTGRGVQLGTPKQVVVATKMEDTGSGNGTTPAPPQ